MVKVDRPVWFFEAHIWDWKKGGCANICGDVILIDGVKIYLHRN